MRRFLLLLLVTSILPSVANGQRRTRRTPASYSQTGSLMLGVQHLDLGDFNDALIGRYPQVNDNLFAIGGQGLHIRRRFIIGGEGMAVVAPRRETTDGTFHTRFMAGYGTLNIGYAAVDKNNWLVYPLFAIGGGGVQYTITPTNSATFNNVLLDPGRSSHMTTASMVLGVRAGVQRNFRMRSRRTPMMLGGLSVGARVAYNFAPLHGTWREMQGGDITGGPTTTVAGPQLVFTIGGWRQGR